MQDREGIIAADDNALFLRSFVSWNGRLRIDPATWHQHWRRMPETRETLIETTASSCLPWLYPWFRGNFGDLGNFSGRCRWLARWALLMEKEHLSTKSSCIVSPNPREQRTGWLAPRPPSMSGTTLFFYAITFTGSWRLVAIVRKGPLLYSLDKRLPHVAAIAPYHPLYLYSPLGWWDTSKHISIIFKSRRFAYWLFSFLDLAMWYQRARHMFVNIDCPPPTNNGAAWPWQAWPMQASVRR